MWVFCSGMMRSGSTLQYQLTSEILERTSQGRRLGFLQSPDFLEQWTRENENTNQFLVLKCHNYQDELGELVSSGQAKVVYIYRDIRDVVVSWMNMQNLTFEDVIRSNFVGEQLANYYKWVQVDDVLVSRYEELMLEADGVAKETQRIAQYLGIDPDPEFISAIAQEHGLKAQMQRIQGLDFEHSGVRQGQFLFDGTTLLHHNHIASGEVGRWKSVLNDDEAEMLENMTHDWLHEVGYLPEFTINGNRQSVPELVARAVDYFRAQDLENLSTLNNTLIQERSAHEQCNAVVMELQSHNAALEAILIQREAESHSLKQIENSWGWRLILRVNRLRTRVLPEGTLQAKLYRRVRNLIFGG